MADGRIVIDTKLDKSGLEQGLKSLQTVLKTGLASIGIASLGKIIGSIANETKALNDSVRKASTLFGDVSVNTDALKDKMTSLAIATGSSSEEIGEALYNALSAGVEVTEDMGAALGFVEKSIKTSKAGFADLATTVTATASVLNAYGMATKEADRVQGILLQTQNLGITTVAELSSTLAQVVPTASAFGVSFEQVGASLATMTAQGTKTAQATTSLNSLLAELGKNGQQGADNLKKAGEHAGIGAKDFKELVDEGYTLSDILQMMDKYAKNNNLSLVDMFGSIEAGKAALQLAANEGEKFDDSLSKMSDTAGLVEQGFSTVLSNADRLKNSVNELKKIIGNEFAPAVDKTVGGLADFIEGIVTNKKEASLLEGSIDELTSAIDDYKKKQEEAKGATDELSLAMQSQNRYALNQTVYENLKIYDKAVNSVRELSEENENLRNKTITAFDGVKQLAEDAGVSIQTVANAYATWTFVPGSAMHDMVVEYATAVTNTKKWNEEILENKAIIEQSEEQIDSYIQTLLYLYKNGTLETELFSLANKDLLDTIIGYDSHYQQASADISTYANSIEWVERKLGEYEKSLANADVGSEAWVKWSAYVDVFRKALDEALKAQEALAKSQGSGSDSSPIPKPNPEIAETWDSINKKLEDSKKISEALGDSYNMLDEQISIATSGIKDLIALGVAPADERIKSLIEQIAHWSALMDGVETSTDPVLEIYKKMNDELDAAKKMSIALGDSYNLASEQARIYESALEDMIKNGLDPAGATAKKLREEIEKLKAGSGESEGGIFSGLFDDFKDAESAGKKLGGILSGSLDSFVDELANAGKRLDELSSKLEDVDSDIVDAEKEKLELQEELSEAQARGDESAIENAEKKLAQLEEEIEAHKVLKTRLEKEKESVESGAEAWKAFGKSALLALAEILDGLGHELTARAVTSLITAKFGDAIIATAGAVGAYTASGLIKSKANSFATGGIVQRQGGTSMTGDNHVAFVNPGELILNQAQQSNLADQIRAMSDGLRSGGSIIISLSGAHIYGLDEPAVGRAIYDNIERLRSEGVL